MTESFPRRLLRHSWAKLSSLFREVKLSGAAGELVLAESRKRRDLAAEALSVATRSMLCDLGKLLNH